MNLRQLEIFRAVMMTGTTVGAAHELNMSQPSVSNAISQLENHLQLQLFHRRKGKLMATDEAKILYAQSHKVFEAFENARFTVERLKDANAGALRIACTPSPAQTLVPIALKRFSGARPDVTVTLHVGTLELVERSVEMGAADLGVFYATTERPELATREICMVNLLCAMPAGHPLCEKTVVTPADIMPYPLISIANDEPLGALIENSFLRCGVERRIRFFVRYLDTAVRLVAEGLGVALVDSFNLLTPERQPDVAFRPFEPRLSMPSFIAYAENRPLSRLARIFMDDIAACAELLGPMASDPPR